MIPILEKTINEADRFKESFDKVKYLDQLNADRIYSTYRAVIENENDGAMEDFEPQHYALYNRLKFRAIKQTACRCYQ